MAVYVKPQKRATLGKEKLTVAVPSKKVKVKVSTGIRIRVDEEGLKVIERRSMYNRARSEADREASMEYAGMRYAR